MRNLNLVKYVRRKKQAGQRKMRMIAMKKGAHILIGGMSAKLQLNRGWIESRKSMPSMSRTDSCTQGYIGGELKVSKPIFATMNIPEWLAPCVNDEGLVVFGGFSGV